MTAIARPLASPGLLSTTVAKKVLMAVTGLVLTGFVLVHMVGNLLLYKGPEALNAYAEFLQSKPPVVWTARLVLLACVIGHAWAAFSLSMVNLRRVEVNLPSAATASQEIRRNLVSIAVDKAGLAYIDRRPTGLHELAAGLAAIQRTNAALRVVISGDTDARHGDIIRVLDAVRLAGVQNVAFELRAVPKAATSKAP